MESNRKRRSFKGKLAMSFYRAPKPSSTQFGNMVKPASPSTASMGFIAEDELAIPASNKTSSVVRKEGERDQQDYVGEECVDKRATTYISSVQQRFKLEKFV